MYSVYVTKQSFPSPHRSCHDRDRMVIGFTTTYAIHAYHHKSFEFEYHSWRGVFDTTLCDKIFSDMQQVGGFLPVLWFFPPIKLTPAI